MAGTSIVRDGGTIDSLRRRYANVAGVSVLSHPKIGLILQAISRGKDTSTIVNTFTGPGRKSLSVGAMEAFRSGLYNHVVKALVGGTDVADVSEYIPHESVIDAYVKNIAELRRRRSDLSDLRDRLLKTPKLTKDGVPIPGSSQWSPAHEQAILENMRMELQIRKDLSKAVGGADIWNTVRELVMDALHKMIEVGVEELKGSPTAAAIPILAETWEGQTEAVINHVLSLRGVATIEDIKMLEQGKDADGD